MINTSNVAPTGTGPAESPRGGGGPNDTPVVGITMPGDGSSFGAGSVIEFTGTATDTEDGDLAASLAWTSDLDGAIGSIRLRCRDSGGNLIPRDLQVEFDVEWSIPQTWSECAVRVEAQPGTTFTLYEFAQSLSPATSFAVICEEIR